MNHRSVSLAVLALCAGVAVAQQGGQPAKKPDAPAPSTPAQPAPSQPAPTQAAPGMLKVGSTAPALSVEKWVKGGDVKGFEKGKAYVVEFWATWCGPCKESIPHLTELAKAHKDVTFIGVAGSERKSKSGPDKRLATLEEFVKQQGAKMDYHVAFDGAGAMTGPWMDAAGQEGIPCAFVVDGSGKITYIGHPMTPDFATAVKAVSKGAKSDEKPKDDKKKDEKKKHKAGGG